MKVGPECALCLFQRGYMEIAEATKDPEVRMEACRRLYHILAENFHSSAVPSILGTMRERMIKKVTGNPDPFAERKLLSNTEAMKILPFAEKLVSTELTAESRFRKACLCAIVGNILEFDIPGHSFEFDELNSFIHKAENDLVIDDISEAFRIAQRSSLILYLTDNAGEIVFDTLFVKELKNTGGCVVVAVKDEPAHNDATMKDALFVGMDKVADSVITIGTDTMGLILNECSEEFLNIYNSADLVVAKGMGYAETLTELNLKTPHLLLLRTKCMNVARYFQVEKEKNIAKLLVPKKT
ncbi:MAG: ARMT1-like domain-containing protein [Candidatus Bathyarchaeia archaeon]